MEEQITRVRLPREGEVLGIVESMLGAGRIRVICKDGHVRVVRIPGKMRSRIWIRPGDAVIVKPWETQSNERADVVWVYRKTEKYWLERKGYLNF